MLVDKQNELMSNLLFTVHQHGSDDVTRKPTSTPLSKRKAKMYFCVGQGYSTKSC